MDFHNHGLKFSGPPDGLRCSKEKHKFIREGKEAETFEEAWGRLLEYVTYDGEFIPENLFCKCCKYKITE